MCRLVFITITILITMKAFSQTKHADREPYADGRFYSSEKDPKNANHQGMDSEVSFTKEETNQLFSIARNSIHKMLYEKKG